MPTKHGNGAKTNVIRCPSCGEDYSITYKRCPFCDERATRRPEREPEYIADEEYDDDEDDLRKNGGKRLPGSSRRGGGYGGGVGPLQIIGTVLSLGIIVAAVWIVVSYLGPLVNRGNAATDPNLPIGPISSQTVTPPISPTPGLDVVDGAIVPPDPTTDPAVSPTPTIPATQTASGFTLGQTDFTLKDGETYQFKPTFSPEGTTGSITWTSSDPKAVSISDTGKVSAVSKGMSTITATMAGGKTQTCIVRSNAIGPAPAGNATPPVSGDAGSAITPSGSAALNKTDFTMGHSGEVVQLKVTGTGSIPVWSIGDERVATISGSGAVTAVGTGSTTVTATVDGVTLKCIVRCGF